MEQTITQVSPQQQQMEKIKSAAQLKFQALQGLAYEIMLNSKAINIIDENTLAIGQQTLSKANQLLKDVDAKRKEIKKPYYDAGIQIDAIAETVKSPLEDSIETIKVKLKVWNTEQEKVAQAKNAENEKKFTVLKAIENQLNKKIKIAILPDQCQALLDSITEKFPKADTFGPYAGEAIEIKKKFIALLTAKKNMAESTMQNDASEVLAASEEAEIVAEEIQQLSNSIIERKVEVAESITVSKSKTRKVWKFEVIDANALPKQFLSADEKKIREYMNANKASFGKEKTVGGVRFYEDESIVA